MSGQKTNKSIKPYLFFNGNCEEALEFYRKAIGAEIEMLMRHKDSPEPAEPGRVPAGWENKVMHVSFRVGDSVLMASDGCGEGGKFEGFSLSIDLPDEAAVKEAFAALSEGGKAILPPTKTFWSPCFSMLTDRFGIGWMLGVPG